MSIAKLEDHFPSKHATHQPVSCNNTAASSSNQLRADQELNSTIESHNNTMSYITCSHCHCGFENRSGLDNHIGLVHYKPLLQAPLYTHPPLSAT